MMLVGIPTDQRRNLLAGMEHLHDAIGRFALVRDALEQEYNDACAAADPARLNDVKNTVCASQRVVQHLVEASHDTRAEWMSYMLRARLDADDAAAVMASERAVEAVAAGAPA